MEARRYQPHYTVEDYEQWKGDWELWQGVPVAMTPSPRRSHQDSGTALCFLFESHFRKHPECDCAVNYELDWRINFDLVVRPDISVVCGPRKTDFITAPPVLIAEILSPSTVMKDRNAKRDLYFDEGVAFYLIVDPDEKTIEPLLRGETAYEPIPFADGRFSCELHDGCTVEVDTATLWR